MTTFIIQKLDWPYPTYLEIQPRFANQFFFPLSTSYVSKLDLIASVEVDIPDDCHSSDRWGVAIFVALEAQVPQDLKEMHEDAGFGPFGLKLMRLYWSFDVKDGPSLSLSSFSTANNNLYLFTMIVSGDYIYIQRHHRWNNKFNRYLFSKHRKPEFKDKNMLCFEVKVEGRKIRKCEWCLLHKEDSLEALQNINNIELVDTKKPSDFEHSSGVNKSSMDEIKEEDSNTSNEENIERSNANFSLGKMCHNIIHTLGFSVLVLLSIKIGATLFLSHGQGLGYTLNDK
ncbi:uncharacterized protein LOC113854789 [Abrus precatorius]|uniref:Uncharacterized protein LOC113854789 n=1 Tax=Abrus precatorius TaxID=3816 RepID=A0A8B8KDF2_ABRPR|nr:uncharacterized protein LOC113854789 [Abrus precatorius]